jgi:DNA helicase-2/ATP-dependent DNA helicase PcrA
VFAAALADLEDAAAAGPAEQEAVEDEGAADDGGVDERALDLGTLCRLCHDYLAVDPRGDGEGFAAWLRTSARGEPDTGERDAVTLATFHAAKGLEWPVVFVTGLERGFVPIAAAGDPDALAEERRLLYVALTRAEDELHCTWARTRRFGATMARREPSPWLGAIESAARALRELAPRRSVAQLAGAARAALAGSSDGLARTAAGDAADAPLAEAIRSWRAGVAKAARVPAYVVIPDRTLDAIARRRPRSIEELLELPGIGPSRAAAYGDVVLDLVREANAGAAEAPRA